MAIPKRTRVPRLRALAAGALTLAFLTASPAANAAGATFTTGAAGGTAAGTSAARDIGNWGEAFGGEVSFHDKPTADNAWYDVPGMTMTFPHEGTYVVTTEVTGQVAAPPNVSIALTQRLLLNDAQVPNGLRPILHHGQAGTGGPSTWTVTTATRTARHFITAAARQTVRVQVRRTSLGSPHPGQPFTGIPAIGVNRIEYLQLR
ncbi:hypothetical protein C1I98_14935 [Spongiactinospora gelatinilytica]|uniref:Uncharacterized protein n=1 Tax=Spongiactinospora gelatinilytica TaxID=2666298 RepID=A0A2W2GC54_9ACTN|nr:hypothetical protein [Spongiactinospora gelatinilytica]PZG45991.1 hypothetical protein C1I98_14935 [Spongiactinospora gelatinilytica]